LNEALFIERMRPFILGAIIGAILLAVEVLAPPRVSDELLIGAYAAILVLISAPFLRSTISGLVCGIVALITQTAGVVAYYGSTYGLVLAGGVVVYSILFIYKLFAFPLAGALAGYLSRRL